MPEYFTPEYHRASVEEATERRVPFITRLEQGKVSANELSHGLSPEEEAKLNDYLEWLITAEVGKLEEGDKSNRAKIREASLAQVAIHGWTEIQTYDWEGMVDKLITKLYPTV